MNPYLQLVNDAQMLANCHAFWLITIMSEDINM